MTKDRAQKGNLGSLLWKSHEAEELKGPFHGGHREVGRDGAAVDETELPPAGREKDGPGWEGACGDDELREPVTWTRS